MLRKFESIFIVNRAIICYIFIVSRLCFGYERAGIKPFCMHALRHTFATRCIERGVKPKALQKILGHSNLATTMDTYVHMTDDSLAEAMIIFENGQ